MLYSSSCWHARIGSRLAQAGATHECGSGDLLETGSAHALARRRGEGTTSQHFERCVCVSEGIWERARVGGGVDLQAKAAIPKAKAWRPRRLAAGAVGARMPS